MKSLLDGFTKRDTNPQQPGIEVVPESDEPTWEVRLPNGRSGMRHRFDGRTRSLLTVAAVVAVIVNAGVAWAYWRLTDADAGSRAGGAVELRLRARSDFDVRLQPGGSGNLTVTLTNDHDFPIRITEVRPAEGGAVADDEHRDAGCKDPAVTIARESFPVQWDVERNTIGAFAIDGGVEMALGVDQSCIGGDFTLPIRVIGHSQGK